MAFRLPLISTDEAVAGDALHSLGDRALAHAADAEDYSALAIVIGGSLAQVGTSIWLVYDA